MPHLPQGQKELILYMGKMQEVLPEAVEVVVL